MKILTEPVGSIPRPKYLIDAMSAFALNEIKADELSRLYDKALLETIQQFEATGSPVITDGEQTKPSFATYPISGMKQLDPNGVIIPFADNHTRQLPKITAGPFRYRFDSPRPRVGGADDARSRPLAPCRALVRATGDGGRLRLRRLRETDPADCRARRANALGHRRAADARDLHRRL